MISEPRRSTLQTQILAALSVSAVESVSAFAKSLEKPRPSVSRSLHRLAQDGYVEKQGRTWQLTETGRHEAALATKALQTATKEVVEITGKKFKAVSSISDRMTTPVARLSFSDQFSGLQFDLANTTLGQMSSFIDQVSVADALGLASVSSAITANFGLNARADQKLLSNLAGSAAQMGDLVEIATGLVNPALSASSALDSLIPKWSGFSPLAEAMRSWQTEGVASLAAPLLSVQDSYASILNCLPTIDHSLGYCAIADQTRLMASTLSNVMQLPDYGNLAARLAVGDEVDPNLLRIPANLSLISSSLADVFHENLLSLGGSNTPFQPSVLSDHLYYSTLPVSHYAQASRHLLVDELFELSDESQSRTNEDLGNEELDPLLSRLDPDFVGKRRGSWIALNGTNPDRLAHAAGSQKNLLLQVLRLLVADSELAYVDLNEKGSKIKARVKQIMGGSESETDHVMAVANAVVTGYAIYNKYDHTNQKNDRALRAHLQTGEALLFMVLIRLDHLRP